MRIIPTLIREEIILIGASDNGAKVRVWVWIGSVVVGLEGSLASEGVRVSRHRGERGPPVMDPGGVSGAVAHHVRDPHGVIP